MEIQEAIVVIRKLADGMHPETGAILPGDCLYHHPQTVRALHRAMAALEFQEERSGSENSCPKMRLRPGRTRRTHRFVTNCGAA
jgi:hypothetical protein